MHLENSMSGSYSDAFIFIQIYISGNKAEIFLAFVAIADINYFGRKVLSSDQPNVSMPFLTGRRQMKLKKWLPEYKKITYAEYKALSDYDRWEIEEEFQQFNRREQIHASPNWRSMTEEEKKKLDVILEKERIRYETNLKIGGIDERGNYTALSHRWENG